jgi:uncharacterized protein (DUF305 family)
MKRKYLAALALCCATLFSTAPAQASPPYDEASVMFAQMMISHHQQAVLISQWAIKQGENAAVKKLAARIIAEQRPEIAQMKTWIPADLMGVMHHMSMQGMVSAADLSKLKVAKGKKFDGLYLVAMTGHHQGAIAMAQPLTASKNSEVKSLAKAIVAGQSREITEMHRIMVTGK